MTTVFDFELPKGFVDNQGNVHKKGKMRLYEGYRHEILHDYCRDEVIFDILNFLTAP